MKCGYRNCKNEAREGDGYCSEDCKSICVASSAVPICLKCGKDEYHARYRPWLRKGFRLNSKGICPECQTLTEKIIYEVGRVSWIILTAPITLIFWFGILFIMFLIAIIEGRSEEEPLYHHAGYRLMAKDK